MTEETDSSAESDLELMCEYFSKLERQGPGSPEVTKKALSFIENLHEGSLIADIGCGTGGQTMVLAEHTTAGITGVDLFPIFVDLFNENMKKAHHQDRVRGVVASMDNLPFRDKELDLIWSEGAIYNIGFARGIREWRKFLKNGGYLAVSEVSWFTEQRPDEIDRFWQDAYPEIDTIPNKVDQMHQAGYINIASFVLPERSWMNHFYAPQADLNQWFLHKYRNNKKAEEFIESLREEERLFSQYKDYYGYVFYIGKKVDLSKFSLS